MSNFHWKVFNARSYKKMKIVKKIIEEPFDIPTKF